MFVFGIDFCYVKYLSACMTLHFFFCRTDICDRKDTKNCRNKRWKAADSLWSICYFFHIAYRNLYVGTPQKVDTDDDLVLAM